MARKLTRLPIVLVLVVLMAALYGGLLRLGWRLPGSQTSGHTLMLHGVLMVCGVFGTVISAERAVAIAAGFKSRLAYGAFIPPMFSAVGSLLLISDPRSASARMLIVIASFGLLVMYAVVTYRQPTPFIAVMGAGAFAWLLGNALWATGTPIYQMIHWWIGFLVLTIVGERLEMARLMKPSRLRQWAFSAAILLVIAGMILTYFEWDLGSRVMGVGELALSVWLLVYDIARRTIRLTGLPRFIAVCLVIGYVWLGIAGMMGLWSGGLYAGFRYDAMLHVILLGFVFSMIYGHAPIIIPALLKLAVPFQRTFYFHLLLMHAALVLRIWGDLALNVSARQWGGLINEVAVVVFLLSTVRAIYLGKRRVRSMLKPAVSLGAP